MSGSLIALREKFAGRVPICLHGTDELPDSLFQECVKNGVSKVSTTSSVSLPLSYTPP